MTRTESGGPKQKVKRWKKAALGIGAGLAAVVLGLVLVCQFLGIRSTMDLIAYREMSREHFHPIWKDLVLRRIKRGDDLGRLLAQHAPSQREDVPPYARLVYVEGGRYPGLTVIAKDGRLIEAAAGTATWRHVFFDAPEQMEGFERAYAEYAEQRRLEEEAYWIHRTVGCGQDVFLSQHVEWSEVPDTSPAADEMMEELKKIYGAQMVEGPTRLELTVEVTKVFYGDLKPGTKLTFSGDRCDDDDLDEPETVFLHVEDDRLLDGRGKGEAMYLTVPKRTLDWYQSLSDDQVREFEARWSDRQVKDSTPQGPGMHREDGNLPD